MNIRSFRQDLRRLERITTLQNRKLGCCDDLSLPQCHLLLEIEKLGEAGVVQLAANLGLDKSTMSRTASSLVENAYIQRHSDASDKRSVQLKLAPKGKQIVRRINREADLFYSSLVDKISARDQQKISQSLELLVSFLSENSA
jgi:DNA-binding MarR family transcriptional regulator